MSARRRLHRSHPARVARHRVLRRRALLAVVVLALIAAVTFAVLLLSR